MRDQSNTSGMSSNSLQPGGDFSQHSVIAVNDCNGGLRQSVVVWKLVILDCNDTEIGFV